MPLVKIPTLQLSCQRKIIASATFLFLYCGISIGPSSLITAAYASNDSTQDISRGIKQFNRGLKLAKRGQLNRAIAVFKKLTNEFPQWPEPFNNLAVIYEQQGRNKDAIATLEAALNTHPSYSTAHQNLNRIYDSMASKAYEKAFALNNKKKSKQAKLSTINELHLVPTANVTVAGVHQTDNAPKSVVADGKTQNSLNIAVSSATREGPKQRLLDTLSAWAKAWSQQDVDAYLSFYSAQFQPARGMAINAWRKQRRQRLTAPKQVQIMLNDAKVIHIGDKQARVRFRQSYQSDNFSSHASKQLNFEKVGNDWRIVTERVLRESLQ
ncbi:MAG TPA: tetratricopeptide repeat protein [Acidiferrobacteraceae bacterium]|nr:tetratricopeptide repeat protein [Acidiferrobacteraceae bacterium]